MDSLLSRITIDPNICHGKPVIRGLRYPVQSMLEYLTGGDSIEDIVAEFLDLERDALLACLEFAALMLDARSANISGESSPLSSLKSRAFIRNAGI